MRLEVASISGRADRPRCRSIQEPLPQAKVQRPPRRTESSCRLSPLDVCCRDILHGLVTASRFMHSLAFGTVASRCGFGVSEAVAPVFIMKSASRKLSGSAGLRIVTVMCVAPSYSNFRAAGWLSSDGTDFTAARLSRIDVNLRLADMNSVSVTATPPFASTRGLPSRSEPSSGRDAVRRKTT